MEKLVKKNLDMVALETCFKDIKSKRDVNGSLAQITRILKRQFDINFKINIVDNRKNKFFGMSIYPDINDMQRLIYEIVNNQAHSKVIEQIWAESKDWHLEIDSLILYDGNLNANPSELVAVLLHEIGHIVYSNTIPQRVNKVMRYELLHVSFTVKKLVKWEKAQRLFDLVIIEACSTKNFHFINVHTERMADGFVVKHGYAESLDSFVGKLINSQGNSLINRTEGEMERDVKGIASWTVQNIAELEFRKTKLRKTLQTELLQSPSIYVRDVVRNISSKFFGSSEDSYNEMVAEQYLITQHHKVIKEGFLTMFDKLGKVKKIVQSDIDIISIELDRIDNQDDKIYVLDLIYDKLDTINIALDLIEQKKVDKVTVSKDKLIGFKAQLDKLRKDVLAVQIKDKSYGVFIKYPKGYEG